MFYYKGILLSVYYYFVYAHKKKEKYIHILIVIKVYVILSLKRYLVLEKLWKGYIAVKVWEIALGLSQNTIKK